MCAARVLLRKIINSRNGKEFNTLKIFKKKLREEIKHIENATEIMKWKGGDFIKKMLEERTHIKKLRMSVREYTRALEKKNLTVDITN